MLEPYENRPSTRGDARFTPEQLNKVVGMLDKRGWQVMTHAIGDAAVRMTLDAYEAAAKVNPAPERDAAIASSTSKPSTRPTCRVSASSA